MAQSRAHSGPPGEKGAKDPRAFLQLAEEHRRSGRLNEAIAVCLEGLGRHPGLDAARITLGRAYLESGQPAIARDTLEEVFQRLPEHHLAGKLLAEAQQQLGDRDAAATTCRDLLRHYPRDREIEAILETVLHPRPAAPADAAAAPASPEPPPAPQRRTSDAPQSPRGKVASPEPVDPSPEYMPEDVGVRAGKVATGVVTPLPGRGVSLAAGPAAAMPAAVAPTSAPSAASKPAPSAPPKPAPAVAPPPAKAATPAPRAPAPATAARPGAASGGDALQTSTLADLYLRQGLVDRAIEVYRAMLRVDPGNERAKQRLAEIESGQAAPPSPATARPMPVAPSAMAPASAPVLKAPAGAVPPAAAPSSVMAQQGKVAPPGGSQDEARRQAIARLEAWLDTVRRKSTGTERAG
jgi:tetratricopeptide (TPR) repeat protein